MATSSYAARIDSLEKWPNRHMFNIVELARSGLYYLGPNDDVYDRLRCAFCEFIVADLKRGDDLWKMHASFVPLCWRVLTYKGKEFVQSVLREEETYQEDLPKLPDGKMDASCLHSSALTVTGIRTNLVQKEQSSSRSARTHLLTERGFPFTGPKYDEMSEPDRRLASFDNTNIFFRSLLSVAHVVAAGFFYTGPGDAMRCYYCGVALKDWNRMDEPWVEHAKHASYCMHVILTKGEEFIEKVIVERSGEMIRPPLQHACNRKRRFEPEPSGEAVDNKSFRVVGVKDREGTERNRSENMNVFPSTGTNESTVTCDRCQAAADVVTGTGSVCDRTWTCQMCSRLFQN